jgi:hypothetical protein
MRIVRLIGIIKNNWMNFKYKEILKLIKKM